MYRRTLFLAATSLAVAVLAAAVYAIAKPRPKQTPVRLIFPKDSGDQQLWPNNNAWVWSIEGLDPEAKGKAITLIARVVKERIEKGIHPVVEPRIITKAECKAKISVGGKVVGVKPNDSALVSIQVVDLGAVAVPTGRKSRSLRVLLNLSIRGSTPI
jgi:hypothetical protein